jgi:beta-lactamase regulating signal transducer with metallopeptidase domain
MLAWLLNGDILVAEWTDSILRALWQGSMVLGLVWVITAIFPKIHPTIRCWLWRIVYLKLLISFLVTPFHIPYFSTLKDFPVPVARILNTNPVSQLISTIPVTSCLSQISPPLFLRPQFWFCLWLLGVGFSLIGFILLWFQNRKVRKDFHPYSLDKMLKSFYIKLCSSLKIKKPPRLLVSGSIHSPVLQGLLHPQIILPETFLSQYSPEEIKVMLAHELAHYKHRDLFWNWLPLIIRGLFFFHPLVWLAERQWHDSHEICCDHWALQFTQADVADYGRILLKTTTMQPRLNFKNGIPQVAVSYSSPTKQTLKKRLLALKYHSSLNSKVILVVFLIVALAGTTILLPWKLAPPIIIGITHYRNFTYDYSNVNNSMAIYVEIPFPNIIIEKLDVIIGNLKSAELSDSGDVPTGYTSRLSIISPNKMKNPQEVKFLIRTNAGDFQGKYMTDFGKTNYNYGMQEVYITF